jgi:hypothetical protein
VSLGRDRVAYVGEAGDVSQRALEAPPSLPRERPNTLDRLAVIHMHEFRADDPLKLRDEPLLDPLVKKARSSGRAASENARFFGAKSDTSAKEPAKSQVRLIGRPAC